MKKYIFLIIIAFALNSSSLLHSMNSKKKNKKKSIQIPYSQMINHDNGSLYVTDDSLKNNFNEQKMLSTGSLEALAHLKQQNVVVSLDDLENQGYKIIKPQSRWRRWGSALRRYSTAFCVVGTTVGVGILVYYLYTAKAQIEKVEPFINKAENFIDKGEQTLNNINEVIKQVCKQFHFPWCSKINPK